MSISAIIEGEIKNGIITYTDYGSYESRADSMIRLFKKAFDLLKDINFADQYFYIQTGDWSERIEDEVTLFGFTFVDGVNIIPDFGFDRWIECGIDNYEEYTKKIYEAGVEEPIYDKLFWIGSIDTQSLRQELLKIGECNKDLMEIVPMKWLKRKFKGERHNSTNYISLIDHAKYKYLIDCGARGYSGRVKFLLYANRPLFLVEREKHKQDHYYPKLVAFEHFIPVKSDLSDLKEMLIWAKENETECKQIALNARDFAVRELSKEKILDHIKNQLFTNLVINS